MTDPVTTASSSTTYTRPQQCTSQGKNGAICKSEDARPLHGPLAFNDRSSSVLGLPKLIPRSAVIRSSLVPSPSDSPSLLAKDTLPELDQSSVDGAGSSRPNIRQARSGRLSMMDFLAVEPPEDDNPLLSPALDTLPSRLALPATSNDKQQASPRTGGKKSFGLVPRLGSLGNNTVSPPVSRSVLNSSRLGSDGEESASPNLPGDKSPPAKMQDFYTADRRDESTPHSAKGKRKADGFTSSTPLIQLKVVPVTDSIIMFGSTQTSSNYSLSGKVVLQTNSWKRKDEGAMQPIAFDTPIKRHDSPLNIAPEGSPANSSVRGRSPEPSNVSEREGRVDDITIRSLQVVFSGFALYVDHTGRFSAMRLAHVKQELISQGASIPTAAGLGQEYEIEFNLSVPGWLPSTLSTRFGGTFYCLEAKVDYTHANGSDRTSMAALIPPPRNASRAASPSPLSSSLEGSSYDSDAPAPSANILSKDEQLRRLLGSYPKDHDGQNNSALGGSRKGSWLSKLAKVSKSSNSSGPNSPSSTVNTPTHSIMDAKSPSTLPNSPYTVTCSSTDGTSHAQSRAKAIIIARCREVVPVPVARMAIIGPEGLPEGAHQDPPPLVRSSSFDAATRSRSSTVTRSTILASPTMRTLSPPPIAPSAFNAPSDPAKLAAHASSSFHAQPRTPQRASSATQVYHNARDGAAQPTVDRSSRGHASPYTSSSTIPMRHFLHRPMLHPPADAQIQNADGGLSFSLTLTLPSYVSVDGPGSDVLSFGVQIEVGRSASWSKVRELGGLRLRDMELSCVQTERHSSVASRTFCHSYPLPLDPKIGPHELPIMEVWGGSARERTSSQQDAAKLRCGYDRAMIEDHMELVRQGRAPLTSEQNVERVRVAVVGPPSSHGHSKGPRERDQGGEGSKSKDKDKDTPKDSASKKVRRRSMPASSSAPSGLVGQREGSSDAPVEEADRDGTEANKKTGRGRGRRAYQSAIRGLSNLATAVMDITLDAEGAGHGSEESDGLAHRKSKGADEVKQTALYSFAGSDGHGVDLTKGRVRMAINLPLVSSNVVRAKAAGTPRLVADFESPYIRVRHKLKVKLGFGFGSKPLGGEGDGNWGQALVMCVPVRFTDSAPREVREQFAPMPIAQVASSGAGLPSMPKASKMNANDAPLLPSYNQLFREDGSRLADEGEDLPQYPGPAGRRFSAAVPPSGSVTAPSPLIGSNADTVTIDELTTFDNRITPSRVLDESVADTFSDAVSRQQQLELEEMEEEEEEEQTQTADRLNETVNMDDMDEEYGDDDAMDVFSSSDQGRSGLDEEDSADE